MATVFFPAPKLHHPAASRAHSGLPNFDHFISVEHRKTSLHATAIFMTSLCRVVQILQLIKYFSGLFRKMRKLFPFAAREGQLFPNVDRLTFACGNFGWSILGLRTVGWWGGIFGEFSVALDPIFCILYSFFLCFAQLCQTIAAFLLIVKMKTLVERCLSNYTLMEIFSVFFV